MLYFLLCCRLVYVHPAGRLYNVNRTMLCNLQTHVLIFVYFQKNLRWPFMKKCNATLNMNTVYANGEKRHKWHTESNLQQSHLINYE